MNFWTPCLVLIVVFWISFALVYFALRGRIARLERRMKRVERTIQGRQTEDLPQSQVQPPPRPRPVAPSRYVTVERQPKW